MGGHSQARAPVRATQGQPGRQQAGPWVTAFPVRALHSEATPIPVPVGSEHCPGQLTHAPQASFWAQAWQQSKGEVTLVRDCSWTPP